MSKIIASSAIRGAHEIVRQAGEFLARAVAAHGPDSAVGFPNTAYALPVIYSLTGRRVERLRDIEPVLEECRRLLPAVPGESVWLPYLGDALDAGIATLFAFEIVEACKYLVGPHPVNGLWLGAASDVIIRERGIEFVDGSAPGFAAVVGAAPTREDAVRIARELQEKNLYVFMAGHTGGTSFAEQLVEAGIELGWQTRLVPFGKEISAAIYALGFANRVALSFGGVEPGDHARNLKYNKDRIFAFVMALGEVTDEKYAAAAGAISYGFPTIADTAIPQILPTGICTYEHVVSSVPIDRMVEKCLEVRGCKVRISKVPVPVAYGAAFEGERIRKEQTWVEFGGNRTPAFEFVATRELAEVEDGRITVTGPEIDDVAEGAALPLGIWVEVAGRKMQADFEPILERQIHHLINGAEGVWHMGQRDINWIRISKSARERGFKIRHLGAILHARFLNDYPAIVDKVQVTLLTDLKEVEARIGAARQVYRARNQRMESLTDESVDTFYSCLLCQSFAPNHVCVITPERLGLCGAYNWLDGKAAFEIDPTGPNQPLVKGECLDPVRGQWKNINDYVYANSRQTIRAFNAYSLMENPMTSCGCFEAIVAVLPECNGVMVVNREYTGETPAGMKFSTLANMTGGGQQVPGFIGVGKAYVGSRKFIAAEGGRQRIVWMPRELKDALREELGEFVDLIADETVGTGEAAVRAFMEKVHHPALGMPEITATPADAEPEPGIAAAAPAAAAPPAAAPRAPAAPSTAPQAPLAVTPSVPLPPAGPSAAFLPPAVTWAAPQSPSAAPSAATSPFAVAWAAPSPQPATPFAVPQAPLAVTPSAPPPPAGLSAASLPPTVAWAAPQPSPTAPSAAPPPLAAASAAPAEVSTDGIGEIIAVLERLRSVPLETRVQPGMSAARQMAALQASTALHLLHAGANMLLMHGAPAAAEPMPPAKPPEAPPAPPPPPPPPPPPEPQAARASAAIAVPACVKLPAGNVNAAVRAVTLGGSGTRTSAVTIGGAQALPFCHFEGDTGCRPAVAMEVFDQEPKGYPEALRAAYGALLKDPAAMARYCVEKLGAEVISIRLPGTHPENGDRSPQAAADVVKSVLGAVGVPVIVTGPNHFEKNNAVMKAIAAAFAGENLLLNWVETDNYKTIAAAAMGNGHAVVAQTPIDVNMCKQLNILLTNMGVAPEKIVVDPLTGALGYGLEYTYSVMERIRTSAFTGDAMLAMPMLINPGYEVWRTKESRAPRSAFPLWGKEEERGALLEVATATSLLNAGADLLVLYHPLAARTLKSKIEEMTTWR